MWPDGIANIVFIRCTDLLVPHLGPIYRATFSLGTYPKQWKDLVTVVLRKPMKPDYMLLSTHQLIELLNTMAKILSVCVTEDLVHMAEMHGLLPKNHFGCRPGRTMMDSLHYVTKYMKDSWRRTEVMSALFLDVKSAFPSVVLEQLGCDMRQRGVPATYTDWITRKVECQTTTLAFDGFVLEPVPLRRGIDQGCPLSGILFQFYNADLIDGYDPKAGESAVAFVDDILILAHVSTLTEANSKLIHMMEHPGGGLDWSCTHHCDFAMDKFGVMGITRKWEPDRNAPGQSRGSPYP